MELPQRYEDFQKISILGSGAFGEVTLWKNTITEECYAVKRCRKFDIKSLTKRQMERWRNEVNIIKTMKCPTIVAYKELPAHFEQFLMHYNPSKLPLLPMEYCKDGNLRYTLLRPENICGLTEEEIRNILHDIGRAVAYLHSLQITHRDIKPENIVLQQDDHKITYKLIDLGYAKELNDATISFVGTLHYLAPEIWRTDNYNTSVDYWSLGVLTFEIICGELPFLPNHTPTERFKVIENKTKDQICFYETIHGTITSSNELFKENHISNCFKHNLELWLRDVFQYDPDLRKNVDCFHRLDRILKKKIITVFSVYTYEFYSYEIDDSTLMGTLKEWLFRDTKIPKDQQMLLCKSSILFLNDDGIVEELIELNSLFYLFKKNQFVNRESISPKYLKDLFERYNKTVTLKEVKKIYPKVIFFMEQEKSLVKTLHDSLIIYVEFLTKSKNFVKLIYGEIIANFAQILVKVHCYNTIKENMIFLGKYNDYRKNLWKYNENLLITLEKCMVNLEKIFKQISMLTSRERILKQKMAVIDNLLINCKLKNFLKASYKLYQELLDNKEKLEGTWCDMCKLTSETMKAKSKILNDKGLMSYFKAAMIVSNDFNIVIESMQEFHRYINDLSRKIDDIERGMIGKLIVSGNSNVTPCQNNNSNELHHQNVELKFISRQFLDDIVTFYDGYFKELNILLK